MGGLVVASCLRVFWSCSALTRVEWSLCLLLCAGSAHDTRSDTDDRTAARERLLSGVVNVTHAMAALDEDISPKLAVDCFKKGVAVRHPHGTPDKDVTIFILLPPKDFKTRNPDPRNWPVDEEHMTALSVQIKDKNNFRAKVAAWTDLLWPCELWSEQAKIMNKAMVRREMKKKSSSTALLPASFLASAIDADPCAACRVWVVRW